jgi:L-seryl-tRNA(Ser) seleniumtransferase
MSDFRSQLPAVHVLLAKVQDLPHAAALAAARAVLNKARREGPAGDWEAAIRDEVQKANAPHLRRVINATGVVLHTNLGRAPLSARAAAAVAEVASGYSNLELDLESGARGERLAGVAPRLQRLFDVEGALAVNNCAAAVLLALSALAAGKEVIVSRGELVEIGGSFRIPDVITSCGARLVEVGPPTARASRTMSARSPQRLR